MDDEPLLATLHDAASAVHECLGDLGDWGETGTRAGQYLSDLAADEAATAILDRAGLGWLSEESGRHHVDRQVTVILDPLDGSTNAHRGLRRYATSLCAVDQDGPRVALVVDQADGGRYHAVRGGGAFLDGHPIRPTACASMSEAVVGLSGYPTHHLGWLQYRALGAAALDLCAVADGTLDAYIDCSPNAHGAWDYLAGVLICIEAEAATAEAFDRDLVSADHEARRTPLAAATATLLDEVVQARRSARSPDDPPI